MLGKGHAEYEGQILPGNEALMRAGLKPLTLAAKEGLAFINGTQVMTAILCLACYEMRRLINAADAIAALTCEALAAIPDAFDARIHKLRPHPGQVRCANRLLFLLSGSERLTASGERRVQDAYSIRCIPQVHGAAYDALMYGWDVVSREINSATDNPLIFADSETVLSGGNFHGQPLALAADFLAIAAAELASISERRVERLVNPALSGLPAFLTKHSGLHSGLMIAQYVAASLVSENKVLCTPASIDSIPSSANQEDHVSMGATAARKLLSVLDNVRKVLAIEWLCACQALEFGTGKLGTGTKPLYEKLRSVIPPLEHDRELYIDIEKALALLRELEL
jgi:histidine ammonia-lyase